jgi:hypothetical protein
LNRQLHTVRPAAEELAAAVGWYEDRRADDFRVIAFAHLKRRPGFWRDRG